MIVRCFACAGYSRQSPVLCLVPAPECRSWQTYGASRYASEGPRCTDCARFIARLDAKHAAWQEACIAAYHARGRISACRIYLSPDGEDGSEMMISPLEVSSASHGSV